MFKTLLFGKSGATFAELNPFHRASRYLYTRINVLISGKSWRDYRTRWIR